MLHTWWLHYWGAEGVQWQIWGILDLATRSINKMFNACRTPDEWNIKLPNTKTFYVLPHMTKMKILINPQKIFLMKCCPKCFSLKSLTQTKPLKLHLCIYMYLNIQYWCIITLTRLMNNNPEQVVTTCLWWFLVSGKASTRISLHRGCVNDNNDFESSLQKSHPPAENVTANTTSVSPDLLADPALIIKDRPVSKSHSSIGVSAAVLMTERKWAHRCRVDVGRSGRCTVSHSFTHQGVSEGRRRSSLFTRVHRQWDCYNIDISFCAVM